MKDVDGEKSTVWQTNTKEGIWARICDTDPQQFLILWFTWSASLAFSLFVTTIAYGRSWQPQPRWGRVWTVPGLRITIWSSSATVLGRGDRNGSL